MIPMPTAQSQVPFVDLAAQYAAIAEEIDAAVSKTIREADFILGRAVRLFEEEFARFCEAQFATGVDSGTSALELALRAYDIGPGDEVITAPNSFIASALAISHAGATPVFADIDADSYTIDVAALEMAITPRTKAIIPVHLYGQPADMDPIMELAERHQLDRKSTRLNSSHGYISYAVFCLKKKRNENDSGALFKHADYILNVVYVKLPTALSTVLDYRTVSHRD